VKLTCERRKLRLSHPFNIARRQDQKTDKEVLLVRIEHDGIVGWGESAVTAYYNQTLDSAEAALAKAAPLLGKDPFALDAIHEALGATLADQPATIAAIDGALHDLCGKLLKVPVWRMLGVNPAKMPLTSFTIGIDTLDVMAKKVQEAAEYPVLKIKIGTPQDREVLELMRREAPGKVLRVDANCGWTAENAVASARQIAPFNIELIEQPTPRGVHETLPAVRAERIAPLIADESCIGPDDVLQCVGVFDGINIKLSKCGGIRPALQMIHTARSAGLKIMLGCMVETSIGISAATQIAPLVDYVDLDGHLLLANDPFEGIGGRGGKLTLNERPGLGVVERA